MDCLLCCLHTILWEDSPIPYNGSGQFSAPSLPGSFNPAISGQEATPADWNILLADLTTNGLSNVICKDGQTTITANIPWAGFRLTGLGAATLGTDAPTAAQVQNGVTYAADTGIADAYVIAPTPPITAYHIGQEFSFLAAHTNATTTPTLAVSGLTAGTITDPGGSLVGAGGIAAGVVAVVHVSAVTTGTPTFQLQSLANTLVSGGGTINNLAWFAGTGRVIASLATANSGLLVTSAGGVPSISGTIPNGVIATTQAQADNSTKLATDAYVDRVGVQQIVATQTGAVATGTTVMPWDDTIPQIGEGDQYMSQAITPKSATSKLRIDVVFNFSSSGVDVVTAALFQDSTNNALAAIAQDVLNQDNVKFSWLMTSGTTSATTFKVRAGPNSGGTLTFNGNTAARKLGGVMASSIIITEIGI